MTFIMSEPRKPDIYRKEDGDNQELAAEGENNQQLDNKDKKSGAEGEPVSPEQREKFLKEIAKKRKKK